MPPRKPHRTDVTTAVLLKGSQPASTQPTHCRKRSRIRGSCCGSLACFHMLGTPCTLARGYTHNSPLSPYSADLQTMRLKSPYGKLWQPQGSGALGIRWLESHRAALGTQVADLDPWLNTPSQLLGKSAQAGPACSALLLLTPCSNHHCKSWHHTGCGVGGLGMWGDGGRYCDSSRNRGACHTEHSPDGTVAPAHITLTRQINASIHCRAVPEGESQC